MLIGVLSDTHLQTSLSARQLATFLLEGPFRDVEMILHAGDHVLPDLAVHFNGLPYYGVCGNMDACTSDLPIERIIDVEDKSIGMIHGWGPASGVEDRVASHFRDIALDVLIFGHSHQPYCEYHGSTLLLNPGSATDRRSAPYHSVALLSLNKTVEAEIVAID